MAQTSRIDGKVKQYSILYLGSEPLLENPGNRKMLVNLLQARIFGQTLLHEKDYPANIRQLAEKYYEKFNIKYKDINLEQALSIPPVREKAQMEAVDLSSLAVEDARTFGGEHLCTQVLKRLELSGCLGSVGFNEREINLASIAIVGRALFTASEYKTASFLEINSELQRMHGHDGQKISHYSLYKIADKLYDKKEIIDKHLYKTVKDLFNLNDTLVIYDLSNTYFEGRKASSQLAQFGKNKEKRNDCKQVVFTGVINQQGFIRHSRVYEGNTSDIPTLKDMIEDLKAHSGNSGKNVVVMDAGIASQENLTYLSGEGLKYVCVARKQIKDYQISPGEPVTRIKDKRDNPIELQIFSPSGYSDTWMYVKSQQKRIKEQSINDKISSRFEQELKSFSDGLARKGTTKKLEKVWERLGRLKEKYRLVSGKYNIDVLSSGKLATEIVWQKKTQQHAMDQDNNGVYFIRANINQVHETMLWDIYNTVRKTKKFSIRKPSKPIKEVLEIYQATNSNSMAPDRKKYVVYH